MSLDNSIDTADMTEDEIEALDLGESEELDESLSEDFISETQKQWVKDHPALPQEGESLDDFIARKEQGQRNKSQRKYRLRIGGREV